MALVSVACRLAATPVEASAVPPANDDFATAEVVSFFPMTGNGSNPGQ